MSKRRLSLSKETLKRLQDAQISGLQAGMADPSGSNLFWRCCDIATYTCPPKTNACPSK